MKTISLFMLIVVFSHPIFSKKQSRTLFMNNILKLRFFRLLSEYSQQQAPVLDFTEAIEELAKHLADISMNEQDYSILLRYFSFGLNRLKSYRVQFGQGENCTITTY